MANVYVAATATWNGKALNKGKKQISSFEKSVKSLGKTFAVAFSARALFNFSKNAINAFAKDEAAAKSLATQLQNMGFGFATTEVERYIGNLEKSTGVLDDHLRPALQSLITATGSLTQSQKALSIALDVSAGTGKSVEEVSMALAKGFTGQTTAISRLGAGIDAATIKTGDMNKIMIALNQRWSGQAKARLDTYAGKIDLLQGAAARASETIGKDLLDSLSVISGKDGIQGAANSMESLAIQTGNAIYGFSLLIAKAKEFAGLNQKEEISPFGKALGALGGFGLSGLIFQQLAKSGAAAKAGKTQTNVGGYSNIPTAMEAVRVKEWYAIRNAIKLRNLENAALTKKTAVDQLKDKFDLERIGLTAALNAATDEETKLRLRSQLAILDNNEALARQLLAQMNASASLNNLANVAGNAAQQLGGMLNLLGRGGDQGPGQALQYGTNIVNNYYNSYAGGVSPSMASAANNAGDLNVTIPVNIGGQTIDTVVQNSVLRTLKNGMQLQQAGGL